MKNCVGQRVPRVVAGWDAYFHCNGTQPATVQMVRGKNGWGLGQIRAPGNALVNPVAAAEIVHAAQQIIDCTVDDRPIDKEPFQPMVESVRVHGAELFPARAIERIAGDLQYIRGTSLGLDQGSSTAHRRGNPTASSNLWPTAKASSSSAKSGRINLFLKWKAY